MDLAERFVTYHTWNKAGEFVMESVFEYGQVTRERKTQGFLRLRQGVLSKMQSYHQVRPPAPSFNILYHIHRAFFLWPPVMMYLRQGVLSRMQSCHQLSLSAHDSRSAWQAFLRLRQRQEGLSKVQSYHQVCSTA